MRDLLAFYVSASCFLAAILLIVVGYFIFGKSTTAPSSDKALIGAGALVAVGYLVIFVAKGIPRA